MLFTEFRFLIFFAIAFSVYWLLRKNQNRLLWLLLCSYIFYGAWDWKFLSLIIISTLVDYIIGWQLEIRTNDSTRKCLISLSLLTNLGILGFFKYFNFFLESGANFLSFLGISVSSTTLDIVLPVGISFYTFQTMSYSLDIYFNKMRSEKRLLNFAVFVSFFPQLVAGPIVRASTFLPQLKQPRIFKSVNVRYLLLLFLVGFIKKACISDNIAPFIDSFFASPSDYSALSAWIGVLLYTVQIYCDFSGYSDMAIACAGFLGYELCLNFDFPYFSRNITEFWRRWHISLSTWLRDYLYIPLGGNRGGKLFTYRNLMLTMLLGGLWHGAGWNFIIWGGLHGIALIAHRECSKLCQNLPFLNPILKAIAPLLTFYWVCFAWIFFRAVDFSTALVVVKSFVFFKAVGSQELNHFLLVLLVLLALIHYIAYCRILTNWWTRIPNWMFAALCGCITSLALFFTAPNYSSFIYFQF